LEPVASNGHKEFDHGGRSVVDQWEEHGILTVPVDFVRRMKDLGFRWGGEYMEKKDLMHFELDARDVLPELRSPPVDGLADLEAPGAAPPPR